MSRPTHKHNADRPPFSRKPEGLRSPPPTDDSPAPSHDDVAARLRRSLVAKLNADDLSSADLARLLTAYAAFLRAAPDDPPAASPRPASDAPPPSHPPRPADRHDPAAPPGQPPAHDALRNAAAQQAEVTYFRGRPAPKKLRGYHPDAPYGRKPDGAPYTQREFADTLRDVLRFNWGLDVAPSPPPHPPAADPSPSPPAADPPTTPPGPDPTRSPP